MGTQTNNNNIFLIYHVAKTISKVILINFQSICPSLPHKYIIIGLTLLRTPISIVDHLKSYCLQLQFLNIAFLFNHNF